MFGKKKEKEFLPEVNLAKIPDDFYGGNNPVIKFKTTESTPEKPVVKAPVLSATEKKIFDKKTVVGAGQKLHPINLLTNWKFLILLFFVLLALVALGLGGYYYWQYRKSQPVPLPSQPIVTTVVPEPIPSAPVVPTPAPVVVPPVTAPSLSEAPLDTPSTLLGDSKDTDSDGLTDVAEELFTTDPTLPDTDGDKYSDSSEIYHLYNPIGKEPMKLIDSGLVSIYTNPVFGYKLYYPKSWAVGSVDSGYKDVLFSTFTGENIEVRVFDRQPNESFLSWFERNASKESYGDYVAVTSVFKQSGYGRKDNLVYFFPTDQYVFAIIYHTGTSSVVNYRIVSEMFEQSFQLGNLTDIPGRIVEENLLNPDKTTSTSANVLNVTTSIATSTK